MKKLLLVCCSVFLLLSGSWSQITVTQSNMPAIGYVAVQREDTVFAAAAPGNAGANSQNWDFAGWANHKQTSIGFEIPGSSAGSGNFPAANMAINDGGGISQFVNAGTTAFDFLGMYGDIAGIGSNSVLAFNPYLRMMTAPSTYNTSYNGNYTYNLKFAYSQFPVDSVKMEASVIATSIIDAWGTMTTPSFLGVNVIRQKYTEIKTQTSYIHVTYPAPAWQQNGDPQIDTTIAYRWWSDTFNIPVAEIETNATGSVSSAKWCHSYQQGSVRITENSVINNKVCVYPNPASDIVNITGINEISSIIISDITGKIVKGSILNNSKNNLNISNLNNGIYIYQIVNSKGNVLSNGRFVVTK